MSTVPAIPVALPSVCLPGLTPPGYPGDKSGCKKMSATVSTITGTVIPSAGRSFGHE